MRDKAGRFVKGHRPLIRPKYVYSQNYPKLFCNTCYAGKSCPEYQEGLVCAYKKALKKYKTRNIDDVMDKMTSTADFSFAYMQWEMIQEALLGGVDPEVTRLIGKNCRYLYLMIQLLGEIEKSKSLPSPIDNQILERLLTQVREQQDDDDSA